MRRFDAAIAALEAETGWKAARFRAGESKASFELGDFEFTCHSPDDKRFFFLFLLYATTSGETPEFRAHGYARMAAASALARRTVLSFDEGAFNLHLEAHLAETPPEDIPGLCQEFLNDCDWWRQNEPPLS